MMATTQVYLVEISNGMFRYHISIQNLEKQESQMAYGTADEA